jgi:large subunit ribosomal protein L22
MSSKKARIAADLIRGMKTQEAEDQLFHLESKLASPLLKLIRSAVANGVNNLGLDKNNLRIERIKVDEGTVLKRWMPRAHGRAFPILKRSCHVELILNEVEEGKGRTVREKVKAPLMSYAEIKKITQKADEILEKQKGMKKSKKAEMEKNTGKNSGSKLGKAGGALSKMFRRKSI